jgi:hypothetical protein
MSTKQVVRAVAVVLLIALVIGGLLAVGIFIKSTIHKPLPAQEQQTGSLMLWNMTDHPIEVSLRPKSKRPLEMTIASGARGCFTMEQSDGELIPLRHLAIYYQKRRFKFIDPKVLNTTFEAPKVAGIESKKELTPCGVVGMRYLAVALVGESDELWQKLKERLGDQVKERSRYMVLTNYQKLTHPLDASAQVQVFKY